MSGEGLVSRRLQIIKFLIFLAVFSWSLYFEKIAHLCIPDPGNRLAKP